MSRITTLIFDRWPRLAARHPWRVIAGAILIVILLVLINRAAGGSYNNTLSLPGTESQQAFDLLEQRFPAASGDSATIVVRDPKGLQDPAEQAKVQALISDLRALPEVASVSSPYEQPNAISKDGTIARITVQYTKRAQDVKRSSSVALLNLRKHYSTPGFQVEAGGSIASKGERQPLANTELIGVVAAIIVLLIAFGSVVAMGLPIITALLALVSGLMVAGIVAAFVNLPSFTTEFGAMIGLGVGIDYSLLIVTRFRDGLAEGNSIEGSVVRASATAGRSVFFAGSVVVIALLSLWAVRIPLVAWLGTAGAVLVALSVAVAIFVLPAVLTLVGTRIDKLRIFGKASGARQQANYSRGLSGAIQRTPVPFLLVSAVVLILLAVPVFSIHFGSSDAGSDPTSTTTRRAYDLLSQGFGPGFNGPILVAVQIDNPSASAIDAVTALPVKFESIPGVQNVSAVVFNDAKTPTAATLTVVPTTAPDASETRDLVHRLRNVAPSVLNANGTKVLVGGQTAAFIDMADKISSGTPVFFAVVIGLSFVLLIAVFRSLVIPLIAAAMNLLSVGGAFGLLVLVFQKGWLAGLIGVSKTGPIESFLPMMMFAILFGLSMDYQVFLVTRIHEEYVRTKDNSKAIAAGQSATMRVITAAAAVMIVVFLSFGLGDLRVIKEFGIGMASAIFLDAALIRMLLVPSLMQITGKSNWWFPKWLDRIVPRISVDASEHVVGNALPVTGCDTSETDHRTGPQ